MTRVSDLVEIPEIKTVIQLRDLRDFGLREMILHSFVVTAEVLKNLEMILTSLAGSAGRGAFLKGHFGSGKSHFLSLLSLLLRSPESWEVLIQQEPSLEGLRAGLQPSKFLVVEVSLIQHRGSEFLEDIFLQALAREVSLQTGRPFEPQGSRHEIFQQLRRTLDQHDFPKLVLVVDELSEFLRSKTDAHAFQEDIRFLQYLGEEATSFPLWIVASLQEWIEETGEINQDTFNKIKDRYPLRIGLGRSHLEELVSHRLIRHRPGADEEIHQIYLALRGYFPLFPVDEGRFSRLYPIHPATITLLDRLKPLFSEHRGLVDFIHYRLKGDLERGIPTFLDRPAQELLGPAAIFDHFIHRLRETAETQPYADKVFAYYQDEIPRMFPDPEQQGVALEVIKLLILLTISPVNVRYTARHLAEMILFRVTDLESEINYQYLRDILGRLTRESPYLAVISGKDPLDDQFSIKLQQDLAVITAQRIRQKAAEIFPHDSRLFDRLLPLAESPHLPFSGWAEQRQQRVSLLWENTRRLGQIYIRPIDESLTHELESLAGQWNRREEDFFIVVAPVQRLDQQYGTLRDSLLPRLREKYPDSPFFFWIPVAVTEEDEAWMKEMLSALLLLEGDPGAASESRFRLKPHLENFCAQGRKRLGDIFNRAYFHGLLIADARQFELSPYGYLSQEKFLEEFVPELLTRKFPRHNRIHPYIDALSPTSIQGLLNDFFASGKIQVDEQTRFGPGTVLEGLLRPMGLVKKKGNQYHLHVDPRTNELVEFCLGLLDRGSLPAETLYWSLRKSAYGLMRHQYEVLLLSLLFSGNLLAYQGQRKRGLDDISRSGLKGITALGPGEILREELRQAIPHHPLIPEKWRKGALTLPAQEALWNEIRTRLPLEVDQLKNLAQTLQWGRSFQAFKNLPWDSFYQDVRDVLAQWEEVKVSLSPKDGLERFLSASEREPFLAQKLEQLEKIRTFFSEAQRTVLVYQYLTDERLVLPAQPAYQEIIEEKKEILAYFEPGQITIDPQVLEKVLDRFQKFRDRYIQIYVEAHQRARSGEQFRPYDALRQSRRYQLLVKMNRLEMVSVRHNLNSVDQQLAQVFLSQCETPSIEALQGTPVCRCGFLLTTETRLTPAREIEAAIDLGIRETLEALGSATYQEKLLPYLQGLDAVGEREKAAAVRRLLDLAAMNPGDLLEALEKALTPLAVQAVNEAFRGRVVVVGRDLDQLYEALIRRKYTLPQVHKIIREWLREEEISPSTFVHFQGRGEDGAPSPRQEIFMAFLEENAAHLLPLLQETGVSLFQQALLLSLWSEETGLNPAKLFSLFPFLEKGQAERGGLLVSQLARAAGLLRERTPDLFAALVEETEQEEGFIPRVWRLLEGKTAAEILIREPVFPAVLREALERWLSLPDSGKPAGRFFPEAATPPASGTPDFLARRARMLEALQDLETLRQKALTVKRRETNPPQDFPKWESFYVQQLSPLWHLLGVWPARLERLDIHLPNPIREILAENRERCLALFQHFAAFYHRSLPGWESGQEKRPRLIEDLGNLSFGPGPSAENGETVFLLLDGLRWDLWEYLKKDFFTPLADRVRIVQEGLLWSHFPSSTARQMEFFKFPAQGSGPEPILWKIGGIDERAHTEKGDLEHLFRNVRQYLQLELAPRLRDLPSGTKVLLFSDHGFIENPHFQKTDKYRESRYRHGDASPLEVIVPWARLLKI